MISVMYGIVHEEMLKSIEHLDADVQGKVVLAYVNYQIYGTEPSQEDLLVYSIFKAKQFDLNAAKAKADVARENGKKGGRPRKDLTVKNSSKTKKTQAKPNHNQTLTQENPEKPIDNINNNILSITESKDSDSITKSINDLISELKELSNSLGIVYESKDERMFSKHILTSKAFGEICSQVKQTRVEFSKNIMRASVLIKYWKGPCSGPKAIYQNYPEVFNKAKQEQIKQQQSIIPSF